MAFAISSFCFTGKRTRTIKCNSPGDGQLRRMDGVWPWHGYGSWQRDPAGVCRVVHDEDICLIVLKQGRSA